MSGLLASFKKGSETIGTWFGLHKGSSGAILNREGVFPKDKQPGATDLTVPTTDTAAQLQNQQDQLRNRQRGVLSNIFAGNNAPAPNVATRTLLGA